MITCHFVQYHFAMRAAFEKKREPSCNDYSFSLEIERIG